MDPLFFFVRSMKITDIFEVEGPLFHRLPNFLLILACMMLKTSGSIDKKYKFATDLIKEGVSEEIRYRTD